MKYVRKKKSKSKSKLYLNSKIRTNINSKKKRNKSKRKYYKTKKGGSAADILKRRLEKRLKENFSIDTDYDTFHKINGKIVIHFWDKEYLKNQKQKARNK